LKSETWGETSSDEFDLKKVIFDEVTVREYPQILGDNPAVTIGAPVSIGWKYQNEYTTKVNFFEYTRSHIRRTSKRKLVISSKKRVKYLLSIGYTLEDIGDAITKANEVKSQRTDSLKASGWNGPLDFLTGAVETTGAAFKAIDVLRVGKGVNTFMGVSKKGSKVLFGGMTAVMGITNPLARKKALLTPAG